MTGTVIVDPDDPSTWGSITPSTKRLNDLVGINSKPRSLTPEEIDLLLKSKQEMQRHFEYLTRTKLLRHPTES
ncbi:MAG: hypothetical protein ACYCZ6_16505 [Polaromonas sp.]